MTICRTEFLGSRKSAWHEGKGKMAQRIMINLQAVDLRPVYWK